jgi:hypothetical protein
VLLIFDGKIGLIGVAYIGPSIETTSIPMTLIGQIVIALVVISRVKSLDVQIVACTYSEESLSRGVS